MEKKNMNKECTPSFGESRESLRSGGLGEKSHFTPRQIAYIIE
jgi:hypothetical protein